MIRFRDGLPELEASGDYRKLAALLPTQAQLATLPRFAGQQAISPADWRDCDYAGIYRSQIRDQGQYGSCTGHAGVTALDYARRMAGETSVRLSCTFPYGLVNGGQDQGASVSDILRVLQEVGTCTDVEVGTDTIFQQQFPKTAWQTAKKYRVNEAALCRTFEELCEAINSGFVGALGIRIGQNFNRLNSEGVAPLPDIVIGGHAMCAVGLKRSQQGTWLIKVQNSWTERWGLNGFCYLTRGHFEHLLDSYVIRCPTIIEGPPIAPSAQELRELGEIHTQSWRAYEKKAMDSLLAEEDAKVLQKINEPLPELQPVEPSAVTFPPVLDLTDIPPAQLELQESYEPLWHLRQAAMASILAEEDAKVLQKINEPLPELQPVEPSNSLLARLNEALALDHVAPLLVTPGPEEKIETISVVASEPPVSIESPVTPPIQPKKRRRRKR